MKKIYALFIMLSLGSAGFSQDRNNQLDSLCNQLINVLQKASATDSIQIDIINGHMGSVTKREIRITKSEDDFRVESRAGSQFVNDTDDLRSLKFKKSLVTSHQVSSAQLISNLKEEMKAVKKRIIFLPDFYEVWLNANGTSRKFSLENGTGYGLVVLFRENMLFEAYFKSRRDQRQGSN